MNEPCGRISPPPLPLPLKTCLFFKMDGQTPCSWSFFARNMNDRYRNTCSNSIVAGGGNSIIYLLSNGDPNAPVSFFEDRWGGHLDMGQINMLMAWTRKIWASGGAAIPCFFCDEHDSAHIRNDWSAHDRAIGALVTLLRPYVPAFCIGLESSEYFNEDQHNRLAAIIRHYAPDRYVVTHLQKLPAGGMPAVDAILYEHSWHPGEGDRHSPEEVVSEVQDKQAAWKKPFWPVEYNTNVEGRPIIKQSNALIAAGFGCGGPLR